MKVCNSQNVTPAGSSAGESEKIRIFACLVRAEKFKEKNHVVYVVSVRQFSGDEIYRQWTTRHRYSDFYKLHVRLREVGFPCPKLPPKTWPMTSKSDIFIQQRKEGLDLWLQSSLCIWQSVDMKTSNILLDMNKVTEAFGKFLIENIQEKENRGSNTLNHHRRQQQLKIGKAINITPLGSIEQQEVEEFVTYSVVGNEVSNNFSPHTATVSFGGDESSSPCSVCSIPPTPTSQTEFFRSWSQHTTNSLKMCADILKHEIGYNYNYNPDNTKSAYENNNEQIPFDLQGQGRSSYSYESNEQPSLVFGEDEDPSGNIGGCINYSQISETDLTDSNRVKSSIDNRSKRKRTKNHNHNRNMLTATERSKSGPVYGQGIGATNQSDSNRIRKRENAQNNQIPKIVGFKMIDGKLKFRVRWADTWESMESMLQFMSKKKLQKQVKSCMKNNNRLSRAVYQNLEL